MKTNKDNPKFRGMSGEEIEEYIQSEHGVSTYMKSFVGNMNEPAEVYMGNFVNNMRNPVDQYMRNFVNHMKDPVDQYLSDFVNHMKERKV